MKVVVAIDSFKGSISSKQAGYSVKKAISCLCNEVEVVSIADGGEGSVEAMMEATRAKFCEVETLDPLGRKIVAKYAKNNELAIMEMASSSGLTLLKDKEKNPNLTNTYGLGLMIKDALNKGIYKFIVGIGGSATNDGGMGMLSALGYEFYDKDNKILKACGKNLVKIKKISALNLLPELKKCEFTVACDVNNPLYGKNGAAYIYAAQKGADESMVKSLDKGLRNFAKVAEEFLCQDNSCLAGSGAAGGLGFGFMGFLNSKLKPGFEIISNLTNLEEKIKDSDLVITGEGKLDHQSIMGKTPSQVAKIAKKFKIPVIAFAGIVTAEAKSVNSCIDAYFCIQQSPLSLKEAIKPDITIRSLQSTAYQAVRLFKAGR